LKPFLGGRQTLNRTKTDLAVDMFRQIEMKSAFNDGLVLKDILKLRSALPQATTDLRNLLLVRAVAHDLAVSIDRLLMLFQLTIQVPESSN